MWQFKRYVFAMSSALKLECDCVPLSIARTGLGYSLCWRAQSSEASSFIKFKGDVSLHGSMPHSALS